MSLNVSYKKQSAFGIFFILLLLFSIEISLRTYEYITIPCGIFENEVFKNLNYLEIKNICYDNNSVTHGNSPFYQPIPNQYKFTMNINSDGFRGSEISSNDSNIYKIFLTGGSTVFGFGSTSDRTTIPAYLQTYFDKEYPEKNVEIINAGIISADSYREILLIKEKIIQYMPNMIISYTGVNDSGGYSREIVLDEINDIDESQKIQLKNYPWYRTPFVIYNLFNNYTDEDDITPKTVPSENFEKLSESFRNNWSQSCNLLKENEITSILILQPSLITKNIPSNFEKTYSPDPDSRKYILENYANQLKLLESDCDYTFDFRNVMNNIPTTIYFDNVHMSDEGNKIVSQKIYEKILPIVLEDISD
jgi:lysophospholipase L1-like esterase